MPENWKIIAFVFVFGAITLFVFVGPMLVRRKIKSWPLVESSIVESSVVEESGVGNATLYFISLTVSYQYEQKSYTARDPFISKTGSSDKAVMEKKLKRINQIQSLALRVNPSNPNVAYLERVM